MSSFDHMVPIKVTETIQDVLKIHVAFNTQPRQELSICPSKVKCHFSAFLKIKACNVNAAFLSVSMHNYIKCM